MAIREYILANPARWEDHENNPRALGACRGAKPLSVSHLSPRIADKGGFQGTEEGRQPSSP